MGSLAAGDRDCRAGVCRSFSRGMEDHYCIRVTADTGYALSQTFAALCIVTIMRCVDRRNDAGDDELESGMNNHECSGEEGKIIGARGGT